MFKVKYKYDKNQKSYIVYSVRKADDGSTEFLLFEDFEGWCWRDADSYEPLEDGEEGYLKLKARCELDTGDPFELGKNAEDDDWSNDLDDGTFKQCPFCGGDASLRLYEPPFTKSRYFYVQCNNCEAMINPVQIVDQRMLSRQVREVIGKWNMRQDDV